MRALSRLARAAARMSARRAGGVLGRLAKDGDGVPLPANGWHWSVAHKPGYVAGVAGPGSLGIDIEPVTPRNCNLFSKIATPEEWRLGHEEEWHLFYRFWTAKEAVLKAVGMGLKGLSRCRVVAIEAPLHMTLEYDGGVGLSNRSIGTAIWLLCFGRPAGALDLAGGRSLKARFVNRRGWVRF